MWWVYHVFHSDAIRKKEINKLGIFDIVLYCDIYVSFPIFMTCLCDV